MNQNTPTAPPDSKQRPTVPLDSKQRYEIEEAAAYLRASRATLYNLINAGQLAVIKQGRRTYIPGSEIIRLSSV